MRPATLVLTALVLVALGGSASAADRAAGTDQPIVLRDVTQHELRLEHAPQRVITLLPSLTEIVCALDECGRLVATDRFSDWPAAVARLPKAGGLEDAQFELIVSLKPDVVILSHAARVSERLRSLAVPTFDVETHTYADIAQTVTAIGALLAVPQKAVILNRDIERSVNGVATATRNRLHGRAPRVYYEVDTGPYAAGPQSFIGELLARLGARNIVAPELGPFPKLNPEYVVRHDPDVIFVSPSEAPNLALRPGWAQIRAVKEQRICSFAPQVRDTIVRPGPRVAQGLEAMGECLGRVAP